ncbi:hypothetical protein NHX12_008514 [Muraenolepis orangiensis]|uniref:Uncharacterized protein n=1 Tax=Muraenolepis orangiensis TaxID=630683 RepID=A0A9Q0DLF8_9TELE|nr:hypothetical protein NHX12_008514 [Muraenolepis orangiensis]
MGVKQERSDGEEDGACGWSKDMSREFRNAREAKEHLRESARRMASDVAMTPSSAAFCATAPQDVNNNGGAQHPVAVATGGAMHCTSGYRLDSNPELQAFVLKMEHRAGVRHTNADALFCRLCAVDGCRYCEWRGTREKELLEGDTVCAAA